MEWVPVWLLRRRWAAVLWLDRLLDVLSKSRGEVMGDSPIFIDRQGMLIVMFFCAVIVALMLWRVVYLISKE